MTEPITGSEPNSSLNLLNDSASEDDLCSTEQIIMPHFAEDENTSAFAHSLRMAASRFTRPTFTQAILASVPAQAHQAHQAYQCARGEQLPTSCVPGASERTENNAAKVSTHDGNPIPSSVRYRDQICHAAQAHGLDPLLLAAVAAQETGGPGSNSGSNVAGADGTGHGVFQIDSGTWQSWLSSHHNGMDVTENADKAASILSDDLHATGGEVKRALHLYNAGSESRASTTTQWAPGEKLDYESSVERHVLALQQTS